MNRYVIASLLLFTLLIGLAVFLFSDKDAPVHEKEAAPVEKKAAAVAKVAIPKTIKYRVEVTNPTNRVINDIPIYIAVPVDSSRQQIVKTVISEKHEILDDEAGNRTAKINLPALVPYNTQLIDITINLKVTEQSNRRAQENLEQYTRAERLSESDHPKIKARADRLHADSHKETAKRALDWVAEYLEHGGFVQEDRGALYALENRTADCTEYMYLYGALLRANKIPTRFVSGFIVESNKKLEVADYHNWVEVYLDNTWRVVDPLNKTFLEAEDSYITMRIIDHSVAGFFDNAQQLIKSDSEVKIMMK